MRWGGCLLWVVLVCMLVKYAFWIGLAAAIIVMLVVLRKLTGRLDRWLEKRERRRERKQLELVRRADMQHAWVLAGDDRGIYGDYPPPPLNKLKRSPNPSSSESSVRTALSPVTFS
jgi:hypothetical protein